jgi:L-fuconolactonase
VDIVDIHPHVIGNDEKKYPFQPLGGKMSEWAATRPVTAEKLVSQMDEAGVRCAALVQASTAHGHDNTYAIETAERFPDRFVTVCSVDLLDPNVVQTLDRWYARGMAGIRLFTTGSTMPTQGDWLGDERSFTGWEHVRKLDIPVCVQMRFEGIPLLKKILEKFPDVKIILDHLSKPPVEDGPPYKAADEFFSLAKYPNVYLKITRNNFFEAKKGKSTVPAFIDRVLETFGSAHLAWGSNYPANDGTLKDILATAQEELVHLSPADRENVFSGTALTLYPRLRKLVGGTA